jgi:hypothetical protein
LQGLIAARPAAPFVLSPALPAPENRSLSHADGGASMMPIHWQHADEANNKSNDRPRGSIMKDRTAFILLFLFALLAWNIFNGSGDMLFGGDGDAADGPLGALLAILFAGGGMVLAGFILLVVGAILAAVFAGVGILCIGGLALGALLVALTVSPLLLPLLLPLAVIWYLAGRSRRNRMLREQAV